MLTSDRHLMEDLRDLMPHAKKDVKLDTKDKLQVVNEVEISPPCPSMLLVTFWV